MKFTTTNASSLHNLVKDAFFYTSTDSGKMSTGYKKNIKHTYTLHVNGLDIIKTHRYVHKISKVFIWLQLDQRIAIPLILQLQVLTTSYRTLKGLWLIIIFLKINIMFEIIGATKDNICFKQVYRTGHQGLIYR